VELWRQIDEAKREEATLLETLRGEDAEHERLAAELCSADAPDPRIRMPVELTISGFPCVRTAFSALRYPAGGWVCDVCRRPSGSDPTTVLYHSGPMATSGFDCCLPCAAAVC
jgi:hypothetical protein